MTLLTVPEVAERLRMSNRFVHDELRRGNLRGHRVGGAWRIHVEAVQAYLDANVNVAPEPVRRRRRRAS